MNSKSSENLILVSATRYSYDNFYRASYLGQSLLSFPESKKPVLHLLSANTGAEALGLSVFYNRVIDSVDESGILVFIHDDVWIHDWNLFHSLNQALSVYDLVGVVGSYNCLPDQPGWFYDLDQQNATYVFPGLSTSGCINHFDPHVPRPNYYGHSPVECQLLDGVFLAVRASTLKSSLIRFDEQFAYHCYDADFCHIARAAGLKIGTWPIALTHLSSGVYDNVWIESARRLKSKWSINKKS
jgi:protein O-GlcNAc transferase